MVQAMIFKWVVAGVGAVSVVLLGVIAWQHVQVAGLRATIKEREAAITRLALDASEGARARELDWQTLFINFADAARKTYADLENERAAASDAARGLRNELANLRRSAGSETPTTPAGGSTSGEARDLYAYVSERLDGAAEEIALYADQLEVSSMTCVKSYEATQ